MGRKQDCGPEALEEARWAQDWIFGSDPSPNPNTHEYPWVFE